MKTLNSVIGIIVVALVGYFTLRWFYQSAQAGGPSGSSSHSSGGTSGAGSSPLGQALSKLFGNPAVAQGNAALASIQNLLNSPDQQGLLNNVLDQSNQAVDAGLNDVFIPSLPTQPLDLNQFASPFDLSGGGAGGGNTDQLQTSYDDSSWLVS